MAWKHLLHWYKLPFYTNISLSDIHFSMILGYLAAEYPAVRLLQRLPLAKYSGFCIIAWGITLCCHAAVTNFTGAVVVRLLLGIFEASVSPGWALFTSQVSAEYSLGGKQLTIDASGTPRKSRQFVLRSG